MSERAPGTLFVVATPIGNLEDITLRALRVLREAELVLAEDTRRTRSLLSHHGIETPLESLHAHSSERRIESLADRIAAGARMALVSDAGTPVVSDPGAELVDAVLSREARVEPIPGASALTAAVAASGLRAAEFRFVGFIARSGQKRRDALEAIASDRAASVMFESPQRLGDTLRDLLEVCGAERRATVCRELTKLHEEIARGSLKALSERFSGDVLGEVTLVIEGSPAPTHDAPLDEAALDAWLTDVMQRGNSVKDAARLAAEAFGIDKRSAYQRALRLKS